MTEITEGTIKVFLTKNELAYLPTHNKLSLPIINRIYKKMIYGIKFDVVKVNGNFIIDGHHRYISSELAKNEIGKTTYPKTSATIEYFWDEVQFVTEEWDTDSKILYLNQLDAKYNGLSLEKMIEISK
ncbi:hypothetical protein B0A58_00755 [Flavobacterium branchiophilum NBRC 15030 = ATCC 35035]|uniref:ParB/Sulfiredoxin domain-containing protein n=1 Tax=Flavobacterium branchiophilum TaxID=55197 RepID=A0A543FZS4_9FLAO|nr:hypothetical protein [Flavobacterium branchiophilum]OXA81987.1 hypothetical protein B0A58_00755 [Flavobacterium branchiophilum NBRC 15030 = ATCC 35035]TQM39254.1 hypothetical protein BC670_0028 [Flavobacterium branchiophilum]GEM54112.1 hypothetical protein FB1_03330 [Flavobacterium branchiophilum NBRC 15030 = ATCC 35035]